MRFYEITTETDGFEELRLQALNTRLDKLRKQEKEQAADAGDKADVQRQKKQVQVDKARLKLQAKQKELQGLDAN